MLLLLITAVWGQRTWPNWLTAIVLLAEVAALNSLIAVNGAAANPFAIILLVPLVYGLMVLPLRWASAVLVLSVCAQLWQLQVSASQASSPMMASHAHNMIIGFVLTSLLVAAAIAYLRVQLHRQSQALHTLRERQLRDEQLLAIGTAAAQLTHDAATPVQTLRWLLEEASLSPTAKTGSLTELEAPLQQLEHLLADWREVADDVRESRLTAFSLTALFTSLRHGVRLARPEARIEWPALPADASGEVHADRTLLPALSNMILNACQAAERAAAGAPAQPVQISLHIQPEHWHLVITNPLGARDSERLPVLGARLLHSDSGSGAGAALSNATIEKWGGQVRWDQQDQQAFTHIWLPTKGLPCTC